MVDCGKISRYYNLGISSGKPAGQTTRVYRRRTCVVITCVRGSADIALVD